MVAFSTILYSALFTGHDFVSVFACCYMVQYSYSFSRYIVYRIFFLNMRKGILCFQIHAVTADRKRECGKVEVAYAFKSLLEVL